MYSKYEIVRDENVLTNYRVCKDTGIDPAIISRWKHSEEYRPGLKTLQKLAKYFEVPIEYFLEE